MTRTKLVLGSIAGAVAIHVAFVACSTVVTPRDAQTDTSALLDGGVDVWMDSARDVLADIVEAEQPPDAHADDAALTCQCHVPAKASYTFSGTITRNGVAQNIMQRYSTLVPDIQHQLIGTQEQVRWVLPVRWRFGSGEQGTLTCVFSADRTTGALLMPAANNTCVAQIGSSVGQLVMTTSFSRLTDTQAALSVPSITVGEFILDGFVIRLSQPEGGFVEPPSAYTP